MDHGKVKRTEVLIEWEVGQIIIDVEEEGVLEVLRRLGIRNPVELVYQKVKGIGQLSVERPKPMTEVCNTYLE